MLLQSPCPKPSAFATASVRTGVSWSAPLPNLYVKNIIELQLLLWKRPKKRRSSEQQFEQLNRAIQRRIRRRTILSRRHCDHTDTEFVECRMEEPNLFVLLLGLDVHGLDSESVLNWLRLENPSIGCACSVYLRQASTKLLNVDSVRIAVDTRT